MLDFSRDATDFVGGIFLSFIFIVGARGVLELVLEHAEKNTNSYVGCLVGIFAISIFPLSLVCGIILWAMEAANTTPKAIDVFFENDSVKGFFIGLLIIILLVEFKKWWKE